MGYRRLNTSVICDYATPDKDTALELHMALPVPHHDLGKLQDWLENGD